MMARVRGKDTGVELVVRRALWQKGLRYRVHLGVLGRPDIAFPRERIAIFIDGDFWHGNAWRLRGLSRLEDLFPTRAAWWAAKIRRTMERDQQVTAGLSAEGWMVMRFWESEVEACSSTVVGRIEAAVASRRSRERL